MLNFENHEFFGTCRENNTVKYWAIKQIDESAYAEFWGVSGGTMLHEIYGSNDIYDPVDILGNALQSIISNWAKSLTSDWVRDEMKWKIQTKKSKYLECKRIGESDEMLQYIEQVILFERLSN